MFVLSDASGLSQLPASIASSQSSGKTYFLGLPPHLQNRFFFNPDIGTKGALVLRGEFVDAPAGEDFFHLNALSDSDLNILHQLCPETDTANRSKWVAAINGLVTQFETFSESTSVPGTFIPDSSKDSRTFDKSTLPAVNDPDTAVDSYALSSTGNGSGYVTLVFGNGEAFTDSGDPVVLQVIKVNSSLYQGDLKALTSNNPLDEQVTLRHSGDYGAKPENFEFEWRYGFPVNGSFPTQGNGARATAIAQLGVWPTNFSSFNSGTTRYSTAPTVTITGGGGTGATASALFGLSSSSFAIVSGTHGSDCHITHGTYRGKFHHRVEYPKIFRSTDYNHHWWWRYWRNGNGKFDRWSRQFDHNHKSWNRIHYGPQHFLQWRNCEHSWNLAHRYGQCEQLHRDRYRDVEYRHELHDSAQYFLQWWYCQNSGHNTQWNRQRNEFSRSWHRNQRDGQRIHNCSKHCFHWWNGDIFWNGSECDGEYDRLCCFQHCGHGGR
jgi:hypothetical protein